MIQPWIFFPKIWWKLQTQSKLKHPVLMKCFPFNFYLNEMRKNASIIRENSWFISHRVRRLLRIFHTIQSSLSTWQKGLRALSCVCRFWINRIFLESTTRAKNNYRFFQSFIHTFTSQMHLHTRHYYLWQKDNKSSVVNWKRVHRFYLSLSRVD